MILVTRGLSTAPSVVTLGALMQATSATEVAQHVALGRVIVPGTAHMECMRAVASAVCASDVIVLRAVAFMRPLLLGEEIYMRVFMEEPC